MSLLDDVSIVVSPNGYKAGTLFGVIPVPTEGSNVVVNGDFATDSNWTKGTGWTISGGSANCDGSQTGTTSLTPALNNVVNNVTYIVEYTISNYTSGSISIKLGNTGYGTVRTANGTYTEEIKALATTFPRSQINADASFVGSIDNISVKEYTAADMDVTRATAATRVDENGLVNYAEIIGDEEVTNGDFATDTDWSTDAGWTISGGTANCDGTHNADISQSGSIVGKYYKLTFTITENNAGRLNVYIGGLYVGNTGTGVSGDFIFFATAIDANLIRFRANNFNGSIDNVSVKEVTRDNVPRIDYAGGGCPHILAEPMRTNLLTYSEDFSQGVWVKTDANIVSNFGISPSGNLDADKITFDTTNVLARAQVVLNGLTLGNEYNQSYYLKSLGSDVTLRIGTSGAVAGEFVDVIATSEWQRFDITTTASGTTEYPRFQNINGIINTEILVWGAQMEAGSYATSYIPTSGSTVTRNQDIFTRDGIGSLINSTEGVLFLEMAALQTTNTNSEYLAISDGTYNANSIMVQLRSGTNQFAVWAYSGGVTQVAEIITLTDITDFNKIAIKWKINEFEVFVNGSSVYSLATYTAPTGLDRLEFSRNGTAHFFGKVKQLQVYDTALTDEQLLQLTGESGTDFYESYSEMASALTYTIQ